MAEYIEREAFREYWNKEFRHLYPNDKYLVALANFPAADVVEVRHGEWFLVEYEYLVCGKCGDWYYTGCESTAEAKEKLRNGDTPNYCPNCGAKMDGKGDGE